MHFYSTDSTRDGTFHFSTSSRFLSSLPLARLPLTSAPGRSLPWSQSLLRPFLSLVFSGNAQLIIL